MKKIVLSAFLVIASVQLATALPDFYFSYEDDATFFVSLEERFYEVDTARKVYHDLTQQLAVDSSGFTHLNYTQRPDSPVTLKNGDYVVIGGSRHLFYLATQDRYSEKFEPNENVFIFTITAKAYLVEEGKSGKLTYEPENLLKRFFATDKEFRYELLGSGRPFAVRSAASPFASLEIGFPDKVEGFTILPGYVDLTRPDLYKKNSRPKLLEITDTQTMKTYKVEIPDQPVFVDVQLPFHTKKIRVDVLEVFPGSKFSDLCISAIVPFQTKAMQTKSRYFIYDSSEIMDRTFLKKYKAR